jgi:hypothetical protein
MSGTEVGKKGPASLMRAYTQKVRDHTAAAERLRDQYYAALKRAEVQYFDGMRRIHEALMGTDDHEATNGEQSQEQPSAATPAQEQPNA